jgi:hypothetical protein
MFDMLGLFVIFILGLNCGNLSLSPFYCRHSAKCFS